MDNTYDGTTTDRRKGLQGSRTRKAETGKWSRKHLRSFASVSVNKNERAYCAGAFLRILEMLKYSVNQYPWDSIDQ